MLHMTDWFSTQALKTKKKTFGIKSLFDPQIG